MVIYNYMKVAFFTWIVLNAECLDCNLALEDLNQDGDHKLLVGDLGSGHYDMKLKVYRGTEMTFETPLLNMPTAVSTFYMDNTEPRTPAVAVASGSFIYIYKNLRPYFKFTLPSLHVRIVCACASMHVVCVYVCVCVRVRVCVRARTCVLSMHCVYDT